MSVRAFCAEDGDDYTERLQGEQRSSSSEREWAKRAAGRAAAGWRAPGAVMDAGDW